MPSNNPGIQARCKNARLAVKGAILRIRDGQTIPKEKIFESLGILSESRRVEHRRLIAKTLSYMPEVFGETGAEIRRQWEGFNRSPMPAKAPVRFYPFTAVSAELVSRPPEHWEAGIDYYNLTVLCCPYCSQKHFHGGALPAGIRAKRGTYFDHRVSHCTIPDDSDFPRRGYDLICIEVIGGGGAK